MTRPSAQRRKRPGRGGTLVSRLADRRIVLFRRKLLAWARRKGRHFFWREPGLTPYAALVTEILLTKTRAELVATVAKQILERYPSPPDLACASPNELEAMLFPLGLHRKRAAGLVACAQYVMEAHGGAIPTTIEELIELPSVGRYAANAIVCVVFDQQVAVLDANVSRIYQRFFSLPEPPERLATAHDLWAVAARLLPPRKAKQFNWAILDLGGLICTAKAPACTVCPLVKNCDRFGVPPSTRSRPNSSAR